nr:hypothetical protein [uncultured Tyzzerella sp.]
MNINNEQQFLQFKDNINFKNNTELNQNGKDKSELSLIKELNETDFNVYKKMIIF